MIKSSRIHVSQKKRFGTIWLHICVLFIFGALLSGFTNDLAIAESGLQVYFLNVGQGDSSILICDNEVLMIDGGDSSCSQYIYSFLRNTLALDHIDVMIATHPHADHVGSLSAALNACTVEVLYTSEIEYDSETWQSVVRYANDQGTPVIIPEAGDEFYIGKARVLIPAAFSQYQLTGKSTILQSRGHYILSPV